MLSQLQGEIVDLICSSGFCEYGTDEVSESYNFTLYFAFLLTKLVQTVQTLDLFTYQIICVSEAPK